MSEIGNYALHFLNENELNYKTKDYEFRGLPVQIENPIGTTRSGKNQDGTEWSTLMKCDYGRVEGTSGRDDDMLDVFVGTDLTSPFVYCIMQMNPCTGQFDEHKYVLGMCSAEEAKEMYLCHYDKPEYFGSIMTLRFDDFKKMCKTNIKSNLN
jgi:hypothetical protein